VSEVKLVMLLKRRPDLTPEQFRTLYETGHSRLGMRMIGHLLTGYRRHYVGGGQTFAAAAAQTGNEAAGAPFPYDVITEIVYRDEEAFLEAQRIVSIPENRQLIIEDEKTLFDRENCWAGGYHTIDEDPQAAAIAEGNPYALTASTA